MENNPQTSPLPAKKQKLLNFYEALEECVNGARITRVAWDDQAIYGHFQEYEPTPGVKESALMFYKEGKDYQWIITKSDIVDVNDWYVLPSVN